MLVDTSVWIDHLRQRDAVLMALLERGEVTMHPFVVGELACGSLKDRRQFLELLQALPTCEIVQHDEVLAFVGGQKLYGTGLGWVDVHLLAAARVCGEALLTHDAALQKAARRLGATL
jgi:predicted nucleic acid-binding protein